MAGDESDQYMDDTENIAYISLGAVLNGDDSVLPLLDAPVGSAVKRNEGDQFVPVRYEEYLRFDTDPSNGAKPAALGMVNRVG